jgi:hypothetical protein
LEDKNFLVKKDDTDKKLTAEDRGPGFYDPSFNLVKPKIFVTFFFAREFLKLF